MKLQNQIKTAVLSTLLVSTLSANESFLNKTFVGIVLGYTHLNNSQEDKTGSITLGEDLEQDGMNFTLKTGYNYSNKLDLVLNYQQIIHDDTYLNNFFISTNYKLNPINKFTPYMGANLGYSQLKWRKSPINTTNNKVTSNSYLVGASLGTLYPLSNNIDLDISYALNYTNHTTNIQSSPAQAELNHDFANSFNVGIRYSF